MATPASFRNTAEALGGTLILTPSDLSSLAKATKAVFNLMRDGRWHTVDEIRDATGGHSECLRRMRELRRWFYVDKRRVFAARLWEYRLCLYDVSRVQGDEGNECFPGDKGVNYGRTV